MSYLGKQLGKGIQGEDGPIGPQGIQGIQGIKGEDGSDGEVSMAYLEERLSSFSSDMDCGTASTNETSFLDLGTASSAV